MVSLSPTGDNKPTLRAAHFLQPSVTSIKEPIFELPSLSPTSLPPTFEPSEWPLKVTYSGWQTPPRDWENWVGCLQPNYQSLWKKVGIFEAISNSKYVIQRNHDMVIGIAERWCSETNTCIFPWGEATLTLEDTMVLGGLSVLGEPVYSPVETQELKEIERKLNQARAEAIRSKARKASPHFWIKEFMNSGSEIEHEAFLVFWLSMFVLPNSRTIRQQVFPVAIHLAKGTRIALAPAVLASIYRDLSSLKKTIVALNKSCPVEDKNRVFEVVVRSPLQLVQLWGWERFPSLQPKWNLVICGEPAFSRWHKVKSVKIDNVRLALDSAGNGFLWRPYASYTYKWDSPKLYGEKGMWVPVDSNLDEEIEAFALFLRVSELVGLECIEQYFPHRVAMQFGMDQDRPGYVARCNKNPETAWSNYSKPISEEKLYVPSRISKGDVTTRYLEWWKQSIRERSMKAVDQALQAAKGNDGDVPPGFPLKCNNVDKPTDVEDETIPKLVFQGSMGKKGGNDADVPPGFPPKCNNVENSVNEDKSAGQGMRYYGQSFSASVGKDGAVRKMESMTKNRGEAEVGNLVYNMVEIPGLELETRIGKLERVVAELKAARFSRRFEE